jgi:hypothetical protein
MLNALLSQDMLVVARGFGIVSRSPPFRVKASLSRLDLTRVTLLEAREAFAQHWREV